MRMKNQSFIRPNPNQVVNLPKLKAIRKAFGLSQQELSRSLGLKPDTYNTYETGKAHLSLALFRELCLKLNLDYLDIPELLNLNLFDPKLLRKFRAACQRHDTTPAEALVDFMLVFSQSR
jgi:transcriptional regulator with XRE-family HTH domain